MSAVMIQQSEPLEEIFLAALERSSVAERRDYLDSACGQDAALREHVEALLSAHDDAGSFLDKPLDVFTGQGQETAAKGLATVCVSTEPPASPSPTAPQPFSDFGPYQITGIIGQGGMGMVFQGHEARLDRTVAIKVLSPALASDPEARARFVREARVAAAIRHEHVITIHAIDEIKGIPYLVMEHVQGESLQQRLNRDGPLPVEDTIRIAEQVAAGLEAAHTQGLIHRDIKPANILVEARTGQVKITDFGLARPVEEGGITLSGVVAGTPQYMSPEQARGLRADERSDLFSLGCLLYTLCAGRSPFRADSTSASLERVRDVAVPPVTQVNPAVPDWLGQIIDRLLEKDPERRTSSARAVIEALRRRAAPPATEPVAPGQDQARQRRRTIVAVAALTAAAALIAAVLLPFWRGQRNGPDEGANPEKNIAAAPPHPAPADKIDPAPVADHLFGEIRRMSAPGQLKSLALSPDGKLAYAGTHTGQIHVWNLASGDKVRTIGTRSSIKKIRLSSDGARLAAVGASMLSVFDPQTGVEEFNLRLAVPVFDLAFLPDDRHLLVSCFAGPGIDEMAKRSVGVLFDHHGLTVVDAVTGKQVRTLRVERPCFFYCVACSPDGKWFAAGTQDGSVFVIDAATGKQVHALKTTLGCAFSVAFSDDSKRLYASDNGNHLHGWRLDDYSEIFRCRLAHPYTSFRFSPDETWLAVNGNRECTLLDLTHRLSQGIIALPGHESSISDVAFLPSSDQLVSCSWDGTLRLWKLPPRPARK